MNESDGSRDTTVLGLAQQVATARDLDISGTRAGDSRFGRVDLSLLTKQGNVDVKAAESDTYCITAWVFGELTAWGEAPDLAAAVELLDRWKRQATAPELQTEFPWLMTTASAAEASVTSAQWKWLFTVDHQSWLPVAQSAYAQPLLRELYPYASHGAFALLTGPVRRSTHAMTFYPVVGGGWSVVGRDIDVAASGIEDAIDRAARTVAAHWPSKHR